MRDDLTLVLTIYEGQGIPPKEGWSALVTAQLDGNHQSSDPVPLVSRPKFNLEVTWTLSPTRLRKFKQNRVPLRVECVAVDDKGNVQRNLGYIILHLHTAIQGLTTDARWHKLLGGPASPQRVAPALQLSLNVISSTPTVKEEMKTEDSSIMEVDPESDDPEILNALNSIGSKQGLTVVPSGTQVEAATRRNTRHQLREKEAGGAYGMNTQGKIQQNRQERFRTAPARRSTIKISDDDGEGEVEVVNERMDIEEVRQRGNSGFNLRSRMKPPIATRHDQNPSGSTNHSDQADIASLSSSDTLTRKYSFHAPKDPGTASSVRENGLPSRQQRLQKHSINNGDLPVALPGPSTPRPGPSKVRPSADATVVVPRLNENGGFFQIGPAGEPDEQTFHFSVTIIYAKHLDQVVPSEVQMGEGQEVRFGYSLLGHVLYTDPIKDLSKPDFLADRAGGKVVATAANVSQYFTQHPKLPIHLLLGDVCLATASVDLSQFVDDILYSEGPMVVEGQHPLTPVMGDCMSWNPAQKPMLGATVTLSVTPKEEPTYQPPALRETMAPTASLIMIDPAVSSSDSSTSDSEEEWMESQEGGHSSREAGQYRGTVARTRRKLVEATTSWRNKRKALMYQAAMEAETWKEGQQQIFWQQWSAREADLQRHLAEEWESRVSKAEVYLHHRLDQCQALHRRLTDTLLNLDAAERSTSLREEKVRAQEEAVALRKEEVKAMKKELKRELKKSPKSSRREQEAMEIGRLKQQLTYERQLRHQLQRQVRELEVANQTATRATNVTKLGSQVKEEEIEALKREKDQLNEQLIEAQDKKAQYKLRWVKATSQLHQLLSDPRLRHNQPQELRLDMNEQSSSPPPVFVQNCPSSSTTRSLKYKPDHYSESGERGHTTRRSQRLTSKSQVKAEVEAETGRREVLRRKDGSPGKVTEPKQLLAEVLKGRQEFDRIVKKRSTLNDGDPASYPSAIQEAQKKIRSLDTR